MGRPLIVTSYDLGGRLAPLFPRTAMPEGLGDPITPESLKAACDEALALGSVPSGLHWTLDPVDWRDTRARLIPAIAVKDRWRVGAPIQLWAAGGPCRRYSAAYLADFTLLDEDRGHADRQARRRPAQPSGWRGLWERWFPSSKDPEIRLEDRAWKKPPAAYFQIPDGGKVFLERHPYRISGPPPPS